MDGGFCDSVSLECAYHSMICGIISWCYITTMDWKRLVKSFYILDFRAFCGLLLVLGREGWWLVSVLRRQTYSTSLPVGVYGFNLVA